MQLATRRQPAAGQHRLGGPRECIGLGTSATVGLRRSLTPVGEGSVRGRTTAPTAGAAPSGRLPAGATMRRGSGDDVPAVAAALADAFTGYVWDEWTVAADRHAERLTALQAVFVGDLVVPFGELWLVEEEARPVAAAAWLRPDVVVPE